MCERSKKEMVRDWLMKGKRIYCENYSFSYRYNCIRGRFMFYKQRLGCGHRSFTDFDAIYRYVLRYWPEVTFVR